MRKDPNPTDRHVGSRIRMRRMMLGMSQEKLGDAVDLTFQQIQKYEKGTNRVGASRLQQFATILRVPPAFFFEGSTLSGTSPRQIVIDDPFAPSIVTDFLSTNDGLSIVKSFAAIKDAKIRRKLVELAQQIAEDA